MSPEDLHVKVAVVQTDVSYIKAELSEVKELLKGMSPILARLDKDSHSPDRCGHQRYVLRGILLYE